MREKLFIRRMIESYLRAIHTTNFSPEEESAFMEIIHHLRAILRLLNSTSTTRMQDIDIKKSR